MKPIKPPEIVNQGIAIYVPNIDNYEQAKIEIFYSPKNPLFAWSYCGDSPYKIWEKVDTQFDKGILFIYNSPTILPKGFYKINIRLLNRSGSFLEGSKIYGLLTSKLNLHIGLPYSSFAPIGVS